MPSLGNQSFADLLTSGATVVLLGCAAWAAAVLLAVVAEVVTDGRRTPARLLGCPPPLRRRLVQLVAAVLAVMSLPLASAHAETGTAPRGPAQVLEGLPTPARPRGEMSAPLTAPTSTSTRWVTVQPGDSLWLIAARQLGADAPAASVARLTMRLHRWNRDVIGSDPDLVRPGQRLRVPTATGATR